MFKQNPMLNYHNEAPKRVYETGLVKSPLAFLEKSGNTIFLCSLGESHILLDFDAEMVA